MKDSYFSALYRYAPVGIAILGADMKAVSINSFLLSLFSLPLTDCQGQCLGRVLRCVSINAEQACGQTPDCKDCLLYQSVIHTLKTGRPVRDAVTSHAFMIGGMPVIKTLCFSVSAVEVAEEMRAVVCLSDITREKQYEQLLTRELDLQVSPGIISRQNLIGIVADLMKKTGTDNTVSVGMAAVQGIGDSKAPGNPTDGDVLNRFAEITRQCTRRQDIIGRINNDLFLLMFSGAGIRMAETIIRRIHNTMDAVFSAQGISGVSFSAGFMELKSAQLAHLTSSDIIRTVEGCLETAIKRAGMFVSPGFTALLR